MYIESWLYQDTHGPVVVNRLHGTLFSADVMANKIGVVVTNNGIPAKLTDGCQGYFIRNDGYTVLIEGEIDGNKAFVILPAQCYAIIGQFSLVIKSGTVTIGACTGHIYRSRTDDIVDPGEAIPTLDELLAQIGAMKTATGEANEATHLAEAATTNANDAARDAREATNTALHAAEMIQDAEAWAVGQRDGAPVEEEDPTFENNAKYYAEETERNLDEARQRVADAEKAAETARGAVDDAETAAQAAQEAAREAADTVVAAQGPGILYIGEDGIPYVLE